MTNEEHMLELVNELVAIKRKITEAKLKINYELDDYYIWETDKEGQRYYTMKNPHNWKVFELQGLLRKHTYGSPAWYKDYEEYCKSINELRNGLW